jgi:hypothetical protein
MAQAVSHRRRTRVGLLLLVLSTHLILLPLDVLAIPASDYRENLKNAIVTLELIHDADSSDFQAEYGDLLTTVRHMLPEHQTVDSGGEAFKVDNAWIHQALDELKEPTNRTNKLNHLLDRMRALEQRLGELQSPVHATDSREQSKQKLEHILARPEYAAEARGPNALTRLIKDFVNWLRKFFPKPPRTVNPGRMDWIIFIVKVVILGLSALVIGYAVKTLLVWLLGRSGKIKEHTKREPRIVLGERLEPEATSVDLLSDAEALARQGELRAAIRKAYIALLVELGDRKMISLARHKTNRDYLNSLHHVPQLHSRMRGLTDSFERHWYGFANVTPNDWQDFRAGYLAALESGTN